MRYLITGGDGFLGKHICNFFDESNINYTATSRTQNSNNFFNTGDLLSFTSWELLFQNIDIVIHAAAKAHELSDSKNKSSEFKRTNIELTKELAIQAKKYKVKRFIFLSTIKVNGEFTLPNNSFKADDVPNPSDEYGFSKYFAEQEILKLHENNIFEVVIIRPCLVYGSGVKANFDSLIKIIRLQLPLPFGLIKNKRSLVSIDNLISLIITCCTNKNASGQVFLASDNEDFSLSELILLISSTLNKKILLLPIPKIILNFIFLALGKGNYTTKLFSNLQVDIEKNKKLLNWSPPFSTQECLKKMLT